MIDEGRPALAVIDGVGNFWHGSYGTAGWRSRAGAVMPGFTPNTAASSRISQIRADAYLVDFTMPAVATPANESALGMERWNKAILFGEQKYYSILSNLNFGAAGWPYRCADGTVYFMRAATTFATPNKLEIYARKLDVGFTEPSAVVADIEVPAWTGVDVVNFAPDGAHAAAHAYEDSSLSATLTNTQLLWVAEIAVTGGSTTTAPSVSITLGDDDPINVDGPIIDVAVMETQWTLSNTAYENVTATTRDRVDTYSASAVQATRYVAGSPAGGLTRPLSSSGAYDYLVMVAWTHTGVRCAIRRGVGGYHNVSVPVMTSFTPRKTRQAEALVGGVWTPQGVAVVTQPGVSLWDQTIIDRDLRRISVDGSIVAEIEVITETVRRGTVDPVAVNQNYQEVDTIATLSGPTKSGNGWNGSSGFVDSGIPFAFQRMAGNVLAMLIKHTTWQLLGWSAANGSGEYSYSAPLTLSGNRMPAIHPESGALDPSIRLFF